ncbi:efflux RND transporter periplasmic adaptor subunit [Anaeromyxobacter oryzisoli]|uniref:efflux RND transporter periplasmic adaptor subunit n=1 Tax=Anaeromyxobacter oryzisoli TaxID=2925408 RepID=UPI001F58A174|nr:efflux RND transporter periplasmic adaptor subunit [Anaeromyxobacter sp. SG63]
MRTSGLILACTCALAACSRQRAPAAPPPAVRVEVVASASGASGAVVYSAVAQPAAQVALAFRGPGYVAQVMTVRASGGSSRPLGEGDRVRRGDVLARLRDAEYQDKARQATGQVVALRAAAEKARLDYERATRLMATQSITRPELEGAKAQRDATAAQLGAAEAGLSEARVAVQDTALTSPLDGDVVKKNVEPGAFVGPGTPAFVVADVSRVKVVLGLPDVALQAVAVGQPVAVTTDALPGRRFTARVSRVAAAADPSTRNFDVEVEIQNPDRLWRPGMIASVELTGAPHDPTPRLPLSAFVQAPGGPDRFGVMVVEGDAAAARARLRPVELGEVVGNRVAVTRGLAAGERVITTGASIVADGERVEVVPSPSERR